ncbi:hypothetical protein CEXT_562801 [Caerostris extrusa]|uniref:Uncharacterized protein n=1 Tax=Caerostris extrusa TaxID=172846 RepID=A0AAV4QDY8_CAEEX|nr:hypothetical protein CEXT_562801 [Caerostris extrusa]
MAYQKTRYDAALFVNVANIISDQDLLDKSMANKLTKETLQDGVQSGTQKAKLVMNNCLRNGTNRCRILQEVCTVQGGKQLVERLILRTSSEEEVEFVSSRGGCLRG